MISRRSILFAGLGSLVLPDLNKVVEELYPVAGKSTLQEGFTYYVRTDGKDSNSGLRNNKKEAFRTINRAVIAAGLMTVRGKEVTIQIADGQYDCSVLAKELSKQPCLLHSSIA